MKIASIVGARPNFVKLAPVHRSLKRSGTKHLIIHTGQHYDYEMSDIFFSEFSLPKPGVHLGVGSGSSCFHIGEIIKRLEDKLLEKQIDLVLVYGDTNSTLAGAKCSNVRTLLPVGYIDFIALLQNSLKVVTDSGGIQKEAYLLKVPCITMRKNTEWIETLKGQWNVLTGVDSKKIIKAIKKPSPNTKYSKSSFGSGKTSYVINKILSNIVL